MPSIDIDFPRRCYFLELDSEYLELEPEVESLELTFESELVPFDELPPLPL